MNRLQALYKGYSDTDCALLGQTPALMMPRFGDLPDLGENERRYVLAHDGVYLQARSPVMQVCLRMTKTACCLPFGVLQEKVLLTGGLMPAGILADLSARAVAASPKEWAAFVVWDGAKHRVVEPEKISYSGSHISYLRPTDEQAGTVVLDIHSHGEHEAFFSATDDRSDLDGVYFACVLGNCKSAERVNLVSRIVVDGFYYNLDWPPFE